MKRKTLPPARTPEAKENQLINLAMKAAEEKLLNGTASSQIITTLLNLGTEKARLEREKIQSDLKVANAKISQMDSQTSLKEIAERAINAMRSYRGDDVEDDDFND